MHRILLSILLSFLCVPARAQEMSRRAQVDAAISNAVAGLREDIYRQSITPAYTVLDLVQRTRGEDQLTKTLQRAEQIGGPRWPDDQTCQVRLDISGQRVANALIQIAASNPRKSPLPGEAVAFALREWDKRNFSATGSSAGGASIEHARPPQTLDTWADIDDAERRQAIAAARGNAAQRVIDSMNTISLAWGKTVGDALAIPEIRDDVLAWFDARPATRVEFRDDRRVEVTLATDSQGLFDVFRKSVSTRKDLPQPKDDADWARVREEFQRRIASAVGSATVPASAATVEVRSSFVLPRRPPDWTSRQLDAEGIGKPGPSKLKAARAAETDARAKLRNQLESLPLDKELTFGAAARQSPRAREVLNRSLEHARVYKADYRSDGSVAIKVSLNLADVWDDLTAP